MLFEIIIVLVLASGRYCSPMCPVYSYCKSDQNRINCQGFTDFNEMNPNKNCTYNPDYFNRSVKAYYSLSFVAPNDQSTKFDVAKFRLFSVIDLAFIPAYSIMGSVNFFFLGGFNMNIGVSNRVNNQIEPRLQFINSKFDFYANESVKITMANCWNIFKTVNQTSNLLFIFNDQGSAVYLKNSMPTEPLCPLIFQYVRSHELTLESFMLSFGNQSSEINSYISENGAHSGIQELTIRDQTKVIINQITLNPPVFFKLEKLDISRCSLYYIEPGLFKSFDSLKDITIEIINFKGYFHSHTGSLDWVHSLNFYLNPFNYSNLVDSNASKAFDYIDQNVVTTFFLNKQKAHIGIYDITLQQYDIKYFPYLAYDFPDQDFCVFKDWPFDKLVIFQAQNPSNSCTTIWLSQYCIWLKDPVVNIDWTDFKMHDILSYCNSTVTLHDLSAQFHNCSFDVMFKKCNLSSEDKSWYQPDPYFQMYYLNEALKETKHVLVYIFGPIFGFLGFLGNLLTVMTLIHNYRRRNEISNKLLNKNGEIVLLKEQLYKYMLLASIYNAAYCLIYFLLYLIPCQLSTAVANIYAPSLITNQCFLMKLSINIFCSILKLLSNFTLIQMVVHRYIQLGTDHAVSILKLSQIKMKWFVAVTLILSSCLSVIVYFQLEFFAPIYKERADNDTEQGVFPEDYINHNYYWTYWQSAMIGVRDYVDRKLDQLPVLLAFTFIHDLFSYFLFCSMVSALDIMTIKKLRESIKTKEALDKGTNDTKNRQELKEIERRGLKMVLLSSILNFILRFPELVSIILFYLFQFQGPHFFKIVCYSYRRCTDFVEFANVFYLLSLSTNFIFYVKFNNYFKTSFEQMFSFAKKK